ncbi:hypothetical protein VTN96DRAFT_5763 [Rasamsonia emersonii]
MLDLISRGAIYLVSRYRERNALEHRGAGPNESSMGASQRRRREERLVRARPASGPVAATGSMGSGHRTLGRPPLAAADATASGLREPKARRRFLVYSEFGGARSLGASRSFWADLQREERRRNSRIITQCICRIFGTGGRPCGLPSASRAQPVLCGRP